MTIREAEQILGVTMEEDERIIKMRFRRLMAKHHPDAVQSEKPEHLKKAQLINEAYALMQKYLKKRVGKYVGNGKTAGKNREFVWKAAVVTDAFAERTIFMSDGLFEEHGINYFEVIRGRYEWNPDLEEFHCLLYSLNLVATELLEEAEQRNGIYHLLEDELTEMRFVYQVKVFHLLARQFIAPISSLKKIMSPVSTDDKGRDIFRFDAHLESEGSSEIMKAIEKLEKGDQIYVSALSHNRIMVSAVFEQDGAHEKLRNQKACEQKKTNLGYLSFADDQLYYIVLPILQRRCAQVKCVVSRKEIHKNRRPYAAKLNVRLYLRMEKEIEDKKPADLNLQIAQVLNAYDQMLKDTYRYQ